MFGLSTFELLVILVIILVLFGAGKLPKVMGDLGRGVQAFKRSLDGHDEPPVSPEAPTPTATVQSVKAVPQHDIETKATEIKS